jgi:hypothetical protein
MYLAVQFASAPGHDSLPMVLPEAGDAKASLDWIADEILLHGQHTQANIRAILTSLLIKLWRKDARATGQQGGFTF